MNSYFFKKLSEILKQPIYRKSIGCFSIFIISISSLFSQKTDTLQTDSIMLTNGPAVKFKKGTIIETDIRKRVLRGTLKEETRLWTNLPCLLFKDGTELMFDKYGKVTAGTLANLSSIRTPAGQIYVSAGSNVIFNHEGFLVFFKPENIYTVELQPDNFVSFTNSGYIKLDDTGKLEEGILLEETVFLVGEDKIKFKKNTNTIFYPDGKVKAGTISERISYKNTTGGKKIFPSGSYVEFSPEGVPQ